MKLVELQKELSLLGAKTTGSKKILERRLAIWKEKGLNKILFDTKVINVGEPREFPANDCFKPLNFFKNLKIIDHQSIEKWFLARKAKKGKEKGRILALKLFVKYTQVAKDKDIYFVKGKCCAEQKKNSEYQVQIILKQKPELLQCSCSCPAGAGVSAACKHIGALCFSLEYFCITGKVQEHISCTSESMIWNKPVGRGIDYMSIFEIIKQEKSNISQNQKFTEDTVNELINRGIQCPLTNCRKVNVAAYNEDHNYFQSAVATGSRPESVDEYVEINIIEEDENNLIEMEDNIVVLKIIFDNASHNGCLNDFQTFTPTEECCKETFKTLITSSNILQVAFDTKNNRKLWHQERQFRITASRCYSLFTYQKNDWCIKSQKYFWPKGFTSKSVRYGIETEAEARMQYKTSTGYTLYETGLIISKQHPWLAVSPDGIVFRDNKPIKLLEIKCPVIGKEKPAVEFVNQCDFLKIEDDRVVLKKKHLYYAQVQLGMAILNLPECDFIIYSSFSKSFLNIIVKFDELFVKELFLKLQNCYFLNMLHVICVENRK